MLDMFDTIDIDVFGEITDIDKFLITAGIFLLVFIIQHFIFRNKDKKKDDYKDSLITSHADLDERK